MANRTVGKAKKPGLKAASGSPVPARQDADAALAALQADFARLKAELEAAQARIAAYEAQRRHLADRVEWAIDSLHTILEADE